MFFAHNQSSLCVTTCSTRMTEDLGQTRTRRRQCWAWGRSALCSPICWSPAMSVCVRTQRTDTAVCAPSICRVFYSMDTAANSYRMCCCCIDECGVWCRFRYSTWGRHIGQRRELHTSRGGGGSLRQGWSVLSNITTCVSVEALLMSIPLSLCGTSSLNQWFHSVLWW